jgi:hypothetical protein
MKRFCIACVGFSLLCLAFSCGQQALKPDVQAAQAASGTLFVHATPVGAGPKGMMPAGSKGLLNLSYVTFIDADNIAFVPSIANTQGSSTYQIDATDVPK